MALLRCMLAFTVLVKSFCMLLHYTQQAWKLSTVRSSIDSIQRAENRLGSLRVASSRQQNAAMPDSLLSGQQNTHTKRQGCGSLEVVCARETDGDPAPAVLHFSLQALQARGSKLALRLQAALRRWRFKQALWAVCELLQGRDGI